VKFVATKRLKNYTVPASRPLVSSNCSTSIQPTTQGKKLSRLRKPLITLHTITHHQNNRCSALHIKFTALTKIWIPLHYDIACQYQIRWYTSHHKTLAPEIESDKIVTKRLPRDKCKIEFFHSRHDFRDYDERSREYKDSAEDMDDSYHNGIFTVHFHSSPIVKAAVEYYNNNVALVRQQLEYYSKITKRWKKFPFASLKDDPEIQYYAGKGSRPMPLRVKSEYEGYEPTDDEIGQNYGKVIAIGEDKPKVMEMLYILKVIAQRLGRLEFRRTDEDKYQISSKFINMGEAISTSDWIMHQATIDEELSGIILRRPGALQHIVTCFAEFDELWNHERDPFVEEEDEMEKYRKPSKPDVRVRGKKKKTKKKREEEKKKKQKRINRLSDFNEMFFH
jgi:hypothetical protein